MKLRWTSVAWSVVYLLLLLSLATPLIVITAFFLIVPGILLYTTLTTRAFVMHTAAIWAICALILGPGVLIYAVYFLIPAIIMGHLYKKRAAAHRTILIGAGVNLVLLMTLLLLGTVIFDFNLASTIENFMNMVMESVQNTADPALTGGAVWSPEFIQQFSNLTVRLLPFTMIVWSLIMAAIAHGIARPTLGSMGQIVPKLPALRDWRLPRSLIWYYFVGVLIQMFGGESALSQGFLGTILLNMMPLLQFLFLIQTASLFFFAAYHRKWNPVIPVLLVVAAVFIPPLRIVGILDIAFPLREMLTRPRR